MLEAARLAVPLGAPAASCSKRLASADAAKGLATATVADARHTSRPLKICSIAGTVLATLSLDASATVFDGKQAVASLVSVPYPEQSWIFGTDVLSDDQSLCLACAQADESAIVTMVRESAENAMSRHARGLSSDSTARQHAAWRALEALGAAAEGSSLSVLELFDERCDGSDIGVFLSACCAIAAWPPISSSGTLGSSKAGIIARNLRRFALNGYGLLKELSLLTCVANLGFEDGWKLSRLDHYAGPISLSFSMRERLAAFGSLTLTDSSRLAERAARTIEVVLLHGNQRFRFAAVAALSRFPLKIVVPRLRVVIGNSERDQRISACDLLARLPPSVTNEFAEAVAGFVGHPCPELRAKACWVLGRADQQVARFHTPRFVVCLVDDEKLVRRIAQRALQSLSPSAESLRCAVAQAEDRLPRDAPWRWGGCRQKLRRRLRLATAKAFGTDEPQSSASTKASRAPPRRTFTEPMTPRLQSGPSGGGTLPAMDPFASEILSGEARPLSREEILACDWAEEEGRWRQPTAARSSAHAPARVTRSAASTSAGSPRLSHQRQIARQDWEVRTATQCARALRRMQWESARRRQRDLKRDNSFSDELHRDAEICATAVPPRRASMVEIKSKADLWLCKSSQGIVRQALSVKARASVSQSMTYQEVLMKKLHL